MEYCGKNISFLLVLLIVFALGCAPSPPRAVRYFMLTPSPKGQPPGGFIYATEVIIPFPTYTQIATPGEQINIILISDGDFTGEKSLFRFLIFNEDSKKEAEAVFPPQAGPFVPGAIPAFFHAPLEMGNYVFRVYFENRLVAAASFEVQAN